MTSQQRHILHLTDNNRGGSQRHILDLCRSASAGFRHYILRASPEVIGLHDVAEARLLALDRAQLADSWPEVVRAIIGALDIGCVHAHALQPLLEASDATPSAIDLERVIVTLHDLRAIDPRFFESPRSEPAGDPSWIARSADVLRRAGAIIVPSDWMAGVVYRHYPDAAPRVVENGIAAPRASEARLTPPWPASKKVYAVVGAVGQHKGSETLKRVACAIDDADVVGVVIGYTEDQPARGWAVPDRLYVHGSYQPDELAGLLAAYGCRIVYFPNVVPESFSYVLSEVWQAGLPVIAPKVGALGARVEGSQAGWLLDDPLDAKRAAALLVELLSPSGDTRIAAARAALAGDSRVPSVASMRDAIEAMYRSIGVPSTGEAGAGWTRLSARFHGARFPGVDDSLLDAQWPALLLETERLREWNTKLVRDVGAIETSARRMQVHFAECVARATSLDVDVRELKARNDRIEADAVALRRENAELEGRIGERNRQLEGEIVAIRSRNEALEQHVVALRARNLRVEGDVNALVARNAQLEGDVVALTQRNVELDADVVALKERNTLVESGLASIRERNVRVESDAAALQTELAGTRQRLAELDRDVAAGRSRAAELERALAMLPAPLQNWLLRHAR